MPEIMNIVVGICLVIIVIFWFSMLSNEESN